MVTTAAAEPHVILIAPQGITGTLPVLIQRLAGGGIEVATVASVAEAVAQSPPNAPPPCVLLDLRDLGSTAEDVKLATSAIQRLLTAIPDTLPIALTDKAGLNLMIACIRAGAGDVLDLPSEGTAAARGIVQRIYKRQTDRLVEAHANADLRQMIEDFFRDLIRTERRSIDLEEKLAAQQRLVAEANGDPERGRGRATVGSDPQRPPAVLVIEADRNLADELADALEADGVAAFAYVSGEDALDEVERLSADGTPFDLALVAVQLPGIDGLETVERLRERLHGLPAFLMTASHDGEIAEHAADLGVVGFVHKPFDLADVVGRLRDLANESLVRTREHSYLQRIKERHERVLARYRALPPT